MSYHKRPSISDRALSSPQALRISVAAAFGGKDGISPNFENILTPPMSPAYSRHSRSSTDLSSNAIDLRNELRGNLDVPVGHGLEPSLTMAAWTDNGTLICPYEVDLLTDQYNRKQTFGYGAWSTVYKGTCRWPNTYTSGLATPPSITQKTSPPVLVAVKTPARKDAKAILESEANLLSHLASEQGYERYIVPFYGMLPSDSSLVLAAIPTTLEEHIRSCALSAKASRTTGNMTWPVVGTERTWMALAFDLISALTWLHSEAMVIHGDIKPGNILLVPYGEVGFGGEGRIPYRPIFTDFSSSQLINATEPTLNTLSAVTREYTAPELLSSKILQDPKSTATTASDVFSLAVTLLAAATGNTMIYSGSVFQRQAMATQGWGIIGMVRNSDDGIRIPRQGVVERVIERAVLRVNMGRIDAQAWEDMVNKMIHGDPAKHDYQDSRWG